MEKAFKDLEARGQELWREHSKSVWFIQTSDPEIITHSTAFSITKNLLMTVAHAHEHKGRHILARRFDDISLLYTMELEEEMLVESWDIAILSFKDGPPADCIPVKFAENGYLSTQEPLFVIGHPHRYSFSFLVGHACYECKDDVRLPSLHSTTTLKEFPPNHFHLYSKSRDYRVMADIPNLETLHHHPEVPIVQVTSTSAGSGCSGAPVFKSNGDVIGMHFSGSNFKYSIHVSALKKVLDEVVGKKVKDGPEKKKHKASTSSRPLRHAKFR